MGMESPKIPRIMTERLALEPLMDSDAPGLVRIYQSDGVLRYFPSRPAGSPDEQLARAGRFIAGQQAHWEKYGYGNWGIFEARSAEAASRDGPRSGNLIGWVGLQYLPELDQTEVGFLLERLAWGRGFATEAARAALADGFGRVGLTEMIALVHPENAASRRVIEKCGLAYVDTLQLWGMELMRFRIENAARNAAQSGGSECANDGVVDIHPG
jgi:RimJ/RimL family protein N-acetyltransferase